MIIIDNINPRTRPVSRGTSLDISHRYTLARSGRVFTTPRSRNILATVIILLIIIIKNNNIRCCIMYNTAYLIIMSIIHRQLEAGDVFPHRDMDYYIQDSESCHSTKLSRTALPLLYTYQIIIIRVDRSVIVFYAGNFFFLSRRYFAT